MDGNIDLYGFAPSPPVRAVLLIAHALGVAVNFKSVNILAGEQLKPDFLKMNPMHTVPTIDDNGFVLWESRAIISYLVAKYDRDRKFFVQNPEELGRIQQILFFEIGTVVPRLVDYYFPIVMGNKADSESLSKLEEALRAVDILLNDRDYAASNRITIADYSLATTISTCEAVQIDLSKFPNIAKWYQKIKTEIDNYHELNQKGVDMIAMMFKQATN